MKKILMVCGYTYNCRVDLIDVLNRTNSLGGNSGNMMFISGVQRILMDDNVTIYPTYYRSVFTSFEIDFINSEFSCFILPLADAFRSDNIRYLEELTLFIKKLKIPCYVIGVGLRAEYEPRLSEPRPFDDTVKNFLSVVLDKSSLIGVRGLITGEYLSKLGYKEDSHWMAIGCPSMSTLLSKGMIRQRIGGGW